MATLETATAVAEAAAEVVVVVSEVAAATEETTIGQEVAVDAVVDTKSVEATLVEAATTGVEVSLGELKPVRQATRISEVHEVVLEAEAASSRTISLAITPSHRRTRARMIPLATVAEAKASVEVEAVETRISRFRVTRKSLRSTL